LPSFALVLITTKLDDSRYESNGLALSLNATGLSLTCLGTWTVTAVGGNGTVVADGTIQLFVNETADSPSSFGLSFGVGVDGDGLPNAATVGRCSVVPGFPANWFRLRPGRTGSNLLPEISEGVRAE
jgi:hypothetical protein